MKQAFDASGFGIPWSAITLYVVIAFQVYNDRTRREENLKRRIEGEAAKRGSSAESFERLRPALEQFVKEDPKQWVHVKNLLDDLRRMEHEGRILQAVFIGGPVILLAFLLCLS